MGVGEKLGRAPVLSHAPVGDGDGAGQERIGGGGIAILKRIWEMMVGSGDDATMVAMEERLPSASARNGAR